MRRSTVISTALHAVILVWAVAIFPSARLDAPPLLDVPVDIMTPSEFTKLKAGMVDSKDEGPLEKKPEAPKPKAVTEKTEPKPEEQAPEKAAKPKDEPKPEEKKEVVKAEKPKPVKPEPPKKPKPAPEAKKRDFNADRIAALLNKIPDQTQATPKVADAPAEAKKQAHGQSTGTEMTMSVNEIDALRAKIAQCWSPPPGGLGAEHIVVRLRMQLNQDGSLVGYPSVENSGGSGFFQAAADSAVRAVYQCQPYSSLPADKYSVWRDLILNFDPSQMYGSG